jgi:hypothetical protein
MSLAVLQAHMLAGATMENIVTASRLPAPVVTAYSAFFFSIDDCVRRNVHALHPRVIAPDAWVRYARGHSGEVLKILALHHGRKALEAAIRVLVEKCPSPGDERLILPLIIRGLQQSVSQKAMKAALCHGKSAVESPSGLLAFFQCQKHTSIFSDSAPPNSEKTDLRLQFEVADGRIGLQPVTRPSF